MGFPKRFFVVKKTYALLPLVIGYGRKNQNDNPSSGFIKIETSMRGINDEVEIIYPNGVRLKAGKTDLSLINQLIRLY